jgi:hypothetical protein
MPVTCKTNYYHDIAIYDLNSVTYMLYIQLNESKSVHINFTNRRFEHIPVTIIRRYRMLTQLNTLA